MEMHLSLQYNFKYIFRLFNEDNGRTDPEQSKKERTIVFIKTMTDIIF